MPHEVQGCSYFREGVDGREFWEAWIEVGVEGVLLEGGLPAEVKEPDGAAEMSKQQGILLPVALDGQPQAGCEQLGLAPVEDLNAVLRDDVELVCSKACVCEEDEVDDCGLGLFLEDGLLCGVDLEEGMVEVWVEGDGRDELEVEVAVVEQY